MSFECMQRVYLGSGTPKHPSIVLCQEMGMETMEVYIVFVYRVIVFTSKHNIYYNALFGD